MANRGGLGQRGMDALFIDNTKNVKVDVPEGESTTYINIQLLDRNPWQARKVFDQEPLNAMADSIKMYGVLQPILLSKKDDGRYLIIAGERRYRASLIAGLKEVPAIIKDLTPEEIQEISLIENLHRENLNAIEAAEGIRELMDNHNLTQEEVASRIGKSRPYVTNTLRLLQLPDEVKTMVKEGKLSSGHARTIISIDDKDKLIEFAKQASENDLSVRELELIVQNYFNNKNAITNVKGKKKGKEPLPLELKNFVTSMKRMFSTRVSIVKKGDCGQIRINYYNADDLDRIYSIMTTMQKVFSNENKN